MTWNVIAAVDVCDTLDFWLRTEWPLTTAQTNERAAELGWTVEDDDFLVNDRSGLSLPDVETSSMPSGDLAALSFRTTDVVKDERQAAADFLKDQFTLVVRAGAERWGKPRQGRIKAGGSFAQWDFPDGGARITLMRLTSSVLADFTTPQYAQVLRGLGE